MSSRSRRVERRRVERAKQRAATPIPYVTASRKKENWLMPRLYLTTDGGSS